MIPVLLSGGSGTRLWPVSRARWPKQFCDLFEQSLLTFSLRRVSRFGEPWIVTSTALKDLTERELRLVGIPNGRILYEPQPKNTAAAIAFVCRVLALEGRGDEIVGIFPSDHLIRDEAAFGRAIERATALASSGKIVTLGIQPHAPETGFGYIQLTRAAEPGQPVAFSVERFHEKPSREKAEEFLRTGGFSWNAGIFVFRANDMAALMERHEPDVARAFASLKRDLSNAGEIYAAVKPISIDYAVMEKLGGSGLLVCVPVEIGWSDVGSWDAVAEERERRGERERGEVRRYRSENVFVSAPGKKVALVGVDDLIVVDTPDALLLARRGETQNVRTLVDEWAKAGDPIATDHMFAFEPWGRDEVLRETPAFKSTVVTMDPGPNPRFVQASVDRHWTFTRGRGEVSWGGSKIVVHAGTHVHVAAGAEFSVRNLGESVLEFVEVEIGSGAKR